MKKALALLGLMVLLVLCGCSKIDIQLDPKFELQDTKDLSIEVGTEWQPSVNDFIALETGTNKDLSSNVTVYGEVDFETPGKYDIEYVLEYGGETYIIKRTITVNPYKSSDLELVLNGSSTMKVLFLGTFVDPYVVATNLKNGEDLTHLVEVDGSVDTSIEGIYTLVYKINYRGVVKTKTRDVQVLEDPGLKLTLNNNTIANNRYVVGDEYIEYGVHVVDLFNGNMISSDEVNIRGNFNIEEAGIYYIEYSITTRGREYKIIRTVEVVELITNVSLKLVKEDWADTYTISYDLADKSKVPSKINIVVLVTEDIGGSVRNIYHIYEFKGNEVYVPSGATLILIDYVYNGNYYGYKL